MLAYGKYLKYFACMVERIRPNDNTAAMDVARSITDNRDVFTVYLDLARKLVSSTIGPQLAELTISEMHKSQLIEAEAYAMAQPAHLRDSADNNLNELLSMLDNVGAFRSQSAES